MAGQRRSTELHSVWEEHWKVEKRDQTHPSLLSGFFSPWAQLCLQLSSSILLSTLNPSLIYSRLIFTLVIFGRVDCQLLTLSQRNPEVNDCRSQQERETTVNTKADSWVQKERPTKWMNVQSNEFRTWDYTPEVWDVKNTFHGWARASNLSQCFLFYTLGL